MNVFVVDDAPEVRSRLVAMLNAIPAVNVVGEADSVRAAVDGLGTSMDLMLLDLQLGDGSGLDVLREVKSSRPGVRVIVISNLASEPYRQASLSAGADAFIDKSNELRRLVEILHGWAADADNTKIQGAEDV